MIYVVLIMAAALTVTMIAVAWGLIAALVYVASGFRDEVRPPMIGRELSLIHSLAMEQLRNLPASNVNGESQLQPTKNRDSVRKRRSRRGSCARRGL